MDKVSKSKRSAVMRLIKSKGSKLERAFSEALHLGGIVNLVKHSNTVLGQPDFIDDQRKIAIFLDSCFWHGCPQHIRMPASNRTYWLKKIQTNRRRDRFVTRELKKEGWKIFRIWEHSLKNPSRKKWWITYIRNLTSCR